MLLGISVVVLQIVCTKVIYFKRLLQNCITPYLPLVIQSASFCFISSANPFCNPVQTSAFCNQIYCKGNKQRTSNFDLKMFQQIAINSFRIYLQVSEVQPMELDEILEEHDGMELLDSKRDLQLIFDNSDLLSK